MEIQVPSLLRIKPKALNKLGKYLRQEGFSNIALFVGEGIKQLFWEKIEISFASSEINIKYEAEVGDNYIENAFKESLHIPNSVQAVVSLGGGKAIDFCKYVAFHRQLPMIAVPTLISNDAFASPVSSLSIEGKRRSFKTCVPHGVIIDTEVISKAPPKSLFSGIGDLFCKTTAVHDWKMAYKKCGDYVNDFAAVVASQAVDTFTYYTNKDFDNLEYIGIIASSLLMTGISMIIAGSSRPASGSEHLISHAYDKVADKPSLHGIQVGVASYGVSFLQGHTFDRVKRDIKESGFYDFIKENPLNRKDFIKAIHTAPTIKENFYTPLTEDHNIDKLIDFINTDEFMQKMLM